MRHPLLSQIPDHILNGRPGDRPLKRGKDLLSWLERHSNVWRPTLIELEEERDRRTQAKG
jgi:hypothetical protein